ncbi:hypothetical protein ZOSMA_121G00500 [Zostera marina]|uniref:RAB6-interacting golgin n=1 Tax=Zostera marina TaxID=29655 RepID=A0A0K9Q341_ZOSMR|nr:hypothetical protein ZOSMA_121G00500 [Zostera marina]
MDSVNPSSSPSPSSLAPVIGPDGIAREAPVIAYTEKIIEAEQNQLKKYIQENYSKIRDVERELENLSAELKRTAGPKKAALEHMRKKIELSTERIRIGKIKEIKARKNWEETVNAIIDEEAIKKKLCDDLSSLVQESNTSQFARLEELKKKLELLNPSRSSFNIPVVDGKLATPQVPDSIPVSNSATTQSSQVGNSTEQPNEKASNPLSSNGGALTKTKTTTPIDGGEGKMKKKVLNLGRGKGRGSSTTGWTGAGFDVDGRV